MTESASERPARIASAEMFVSILRSAGGFVVVGQLVRIIPANAPEGPQECGEDCALKNAPHGIGLLGSVNTCEKNRMNVEVDCSIIPPPSIKASQFMEFLKDSRSERLGLGFALAGIPTLAMTLASHAQTAQEIALAAQLRLILGSPLVC